MTYRLPFLTLMALLLATNAVSAETPNGPHIMMRSDTTAKVIDSRSEVTMTLSDANGGQRVCKLLAMSKLNENDIDNMRMLRLLVPADLKGSATLLIGQSDSDDEMWVYVPAFKKARRLGPDDKRDSFIGSELTLGDLLGHKPNDWVSSLLDEETLDGKVVYVIESLPKNESVRNQTGYSKRLLWVDKDSFIPIRTDYWDESGVLLKSVHVSDIHLVDAERDKWQFMQLDAENRQNGHKTSMHFDNYQTNQHLTNGMFTPRMLERGE